MTQNIQCLNKSELVDRAVTQVQIFTLTKGDETVHKLPDVSVGSLCRVYLNFGELVAGILDTGATFLAELRGALNECVAICHP